MDDLNGGIYYHCNYNDELSKLIKPTQNMKLLDKDKLLTIIVSDAPYLFKPFHGKILFKNRVEWFKILENFYIGHIQNNINISWQNLEVLPPVILK